MSKEITLQIWTGSHYMRKERIDVPSILQKLSRIYEKTHILAVKIGWAPIPMAPEIVNLLRKHGTEIYFWLPVFSDWGAQSPLIDLHGKELQQKYKADKGESFEFGCPVDPYNIKFVCDFFERHYAGEEYDGVFLDKIRFPSFLGGIKSIFTCFCPYCLANYNLSPELKFANNENPLSITAYNDLKYTFSDERITHLFEYKGKVVTESIFKIAEYFKDKGYKIGLDLFAPFLSFFVGQDYKALASCADLIKPMLYRETNAPAGIPFELDMYASAFDNDAKLAEQRKKFLLSILNTPKIDAEFINRETADIRKAIGGVKLLAGVEVNYDEHVAPVGAQYIHESFTKMKNVDGFTLSWDLNSTPMENIEAVLECI
jgi:hypothetical protein